MADYDDDDERQTRPPPFLARSLAQRRLLNRSAEKGPSELYAFTGSSTALSCNFLKNAKVKRAFFRTLCIPGSEFKLDRHIVTVEWFVKYSRRRY